MNKFSKKFIAPSGKEFKLADWDPDNSAGLKDKEQARGELKKLRKKIAELQYRLYAENGQSLLIVLQAMDTGGKDGTIRNTMSGINPQGVRVISFKKPTEEELSHDFLWRIHRKTPGKGMICIFNRSHYEDVLVVRVHKMVPRTEWSTRYEQINRFEKMLSENKTRILKLYLHISKDEQRERLQARLDDKTKNWKFNPGDLEERKLWNSYMRAYQDAIQQCNTEWAPWHIIPANRKWARNVIISRIILETLQGMNPKIPRCEADLQELVVK